jgi:hypothetical protein
MNLSDPFFANTSEYGSRKRSFEPRVPIFFFAQYAMEALAWIETALGRDRGMDRRGLGMGGKERPGKRAM